MNIPSSRSSLTTNAMLMAHLLRNTSPIRIPVEVLGTPAAASPAIPVSKLLSLKYYIIQNSDTHAEDLVVQ